MRYQDGFTALHFAALNGHAEVMRLLLDGGTDVNSTESVVNDMV